jgi:hypothetical protein
MTIVHPTSLKQDQKLIPDRLTICYHDPNSSNVKGTYNILLDALKSDDLPGLKITKNARYAVSARFWLPFNDPQHPVCFEAGPHLPGLASYRLDINPAKLGPHGISDLKAFIDSTVDDTAEEFFANGRVTRVDIALDLPGQSLESVIVRSGGTQKHGVYSNRRGVPETVYLGTPRSSRMVAYTRDTDTGPVLRLECRRKPLCLGSELVALKNPFARVALLPVGALSCFDLQVPRQVLADSIRIRGAKRTAALFDKQTGKAIMKALSDVTSMLPDPMQLWAAWPDTLVAAGLGQELGALPSVGMAKAA